LSAPDYAIRILLVDDEPEYGELIGQALPEYHLDFAKSYDEALDLLKAGLPYDVALVDLNLVRRKLKDQLGKKILAYLLANFPSTRRIALTGASPGSVSEIINKYKLDDLLFKRYLDLEDVGVVVEAALARASGTVRPALRAEGSKLWDLLHAFKQKRLRQFDAQMQSLDNDIRDAGHRGAADPEPGHGLAKLEAARADLEVTRASFDRACAAVVKAIASVDSDDALATASRELDELMSHFGTVANVREP
jgi:CheY-like chemotaxis protein